MNICAFNSYRIKHICEFSTLLDTFDSGEFSTDKIEEEFTLIGSELLDLIGKRLMSFDVVDFAVTENKILISEFNPGSGESSDHCFIFEDCGRAV